MNKRPKKKALHPSEEKRFEMGGGEQYERLEELKLNKAKRKEADDEGDSNE